MQDHALVVFHHEIALTRLGYGCTRLGHAVEAGKVGDGIQTIDVTRQLDLVDSETAEGVLSSARANLTDNRNGSSNSPIATLLKLFIRVFPLFFGNILATKG
jgi:hypothetical protein